MATAISLSIGMHRSGKKDAISGSSSRSSPPKEKEEVEKTVYVCVSAPNNCTDSFVIKLSSKDCSKKRKKTGREGKEKEPLFVKPIRSNMPLPFHSWFVALGSTIYCIGSAAKHMPLDVLACDTTNTNSPDRSLQWQAVAAMNVKRECLFFEVLTADDGKMYVFGGVRHYYNKYLHRNGVPIDEKFVCEVFDPSNSKWEHINPPPPPAVLTFLLTAIDLFAVYDGKLSRIILGSRLGDDVFLVTYDVRGATWKCPPQKFIASRTRLYMSNSAFSDNTLYWTQIQMDSVYFCGLYAYDLDLQMLIHGTIMGVHPTFWGHFNCAAELYHFRGDEFYLIWFDDIKVLRLEKIRVSKRIDMQKQQGSLTAYVLSTKAYLLDTEAYRFRAVLL